MNSEENICRFNGFSFMEDSVQVSLVLVSDLLSGQFRTMLVEHEQNVVCLLGLGSINGAFAGEQVTHDVW